jgi:hypothetical protein
MAHSAQAHGRDTAIAAFKKTFRKLAPYKHRYEVFRDFVTCTTPSTKTLLAKRNICVSSQTIKNRIKWALLHGSAYV